MASLSPKLFDEICNELAFTWKGVVTICKEKKVSPSVFYEWLDKDTTYAEKYARARVLKAEFLADQINEISTNREEDHTPFTGSNVIQRDRLISDNFKWTASKLMPRKYGDKIEVDQKITVEQPLFPDVKKKD